VADDAGGKRVERLSAFAALMRCSSIRSMVAAPETGANQELPADRLRMRVSNSVDTDYVFQEARRVKIHLVDGTYELFRSHFGAPPRKAPDGREVGATTGLLSSMLALVTTPGVTHVGCAFDHVIASFRNGLHPGYKTGEGVDPDLLAQFALAERAASALGITVWPMVEFEADDALATAVSRYVGLPGVDQVVVCSPDKDLAQVVSGAKVVCWDRRRDIVLDEAGVIAKFGVPPGSIPDWLALVGDSADGFPGIPGWGAKSASSVLARFGHLEDIPDDPQALGLPAARAAKLVESLRARRDEAKLYRVLATLRRDAPVMQELSELSWKGATPDLRTLCRDIGYERFIDRVSRWRPA
jgi:5'-3' exonuclease